MHVLIGVLLDVLDYALITLFVIVLLCIFVFHFAAVQGDSMLPTLQDGNQLLVNALDRQPEQGEIRKNGEKVTINDPNDATALGHER